MRRRGWKIYGKERERCEEKVDATTRVSESNLEKKRERIYEEGELSFGSLVKNDP